MIKTKTQTHCHNLGGHYQQHKITKNWLNGNWVLIYGKRKIEFKTYSELLNYIDIKAYL